MTSNPAVPEWLQNYCALHGLTVEFRSGAPGDTTFDCWKITRNNDREFVTARFVSRTQPEILEYLEKRRRAGKF